MTESSTMSERIMLELMASIAFGLYEPDEKMPSIRELAIHHHVNPTTITKIYRELEEKQYVYALPAKGYFVAKSNDVLVGNAKKELEELVKKTAIYARLAHVSNEELNAMMNLVNGGSHND